MNNQKNTVAINLTNPFKCIFLNLVSLNEVMLKHNEVNAEETLKR